MPSALPIHGTNLVAVTFVWHADFGPCLDCGLPAAYMAWRYGLSEHSDNLCCVCAAEEAAAGTAIDRLENRE